MARQRDSEQLCELFDVHMDSLIDVVKTLVDTVYVVQHVGLEVATVCLVHEAQSPPHTQRVDEPREDPSEQSPRGAAGE